MRHALHAFLTLGLTLGALLLLLAGEAATAAAVIGFAILAEAVTIRLAVTRHSPRGPRCRTPR